MSQQTALVNAFQRSWSLVFNIVHKVLGLGVYKTAVGIAFSCTDST